MVQLVEQFTEPQVAPVCACVCKSLWIKASAEWLNVNVVEEGGENESKQRSEEERRAEKQSDRKTEHREEAEPFFFVKENYKCWDASFEIHVCYS